MVSLSGLDSYSHADLTRVRGLSPAFARVERHLEDSDLDGLRKIRHRAWGECVAATILESADVETICRHWSNAADRVLAQAWADAGGRDLPAVVLALGKLGARELNLSSDVDLIIVSEPSAVAGAMKVLRRFRRQLEDSARGHCFRLDFDLRPGGGAGPVITTLAQFRDHYWLQGEAWERLALVRLRVITGRNSLGQDIAALAERYAYRPHLEFELNSELARLRDSIHTAGYPHRPGELNIKLERGGIRDVELFTHLQQVIHGGRAVDLRTESTSTALERLAAHGVLDAKDASHLRQSYWMMRDLENRVQMIEDRQTHLVRRAELGPVVTEAMARIDLIITRALTPASSTRRNMTANALRERLSELGFAHRAIDAAWDIFFPAARRARGRGTAAPLYFLDAASEKLALLEPGARDQALGTLAEFGRELRATASVYALFNQEPAAIERLVRLLAVAPHLATWLARRPEVLEQWVRPLRTPWSTDPARLADQMNARKLSAELSAAVELMDGAPVDVMGARLTAVADELALALLEQLRREFPGVDIQILALGKWGGRELGLLSDLDFVFVTSRAPTADDQRVARRFVTRASNPSGYGALYAVDLRLRPLGSSGPLLIEREALDKHLRDEAPAWRRQAYLRARPLDFDFSRSSLVARPLASTDLTELARIRERLLVNTLDVKLAPGGLIDVELTAQIALLINGIADAPTSTQGMIDRLTLVDARWTQRGPWLKTHFENLRHVEQILRLTSAHRGSVLAEDDPATARAAALLGKSRLIEEIREQMGAAVLHLDALDDTGYRRAGPAIT